MVPLNIDLPTDNHRILGSLQIHTPQTIEGRRQEVSTLLLRAEIPDMGGITDPIGDLAKWGGLHILGLTIKDEIIGHIAIAPTTKGFTNLSQKDRERLIQILSVAVDPSIQKQGVFSAMFRTFMEVYQSQLPEITKLLTSTNLGRGPEEQLTVAQIEKMRSNPIVFVGSALPPFISAIGKILLRDGFSCATPAVEKIIAPTKQAVLEEIDDTDPKITELLMQTGEPSSIESQGHKLPVREESQELYTVPSFEEAKQILMTVQGIGKPIVDEDGRYVLGGYPQEVQDRIRATLGLQQEKSETDPNDKVYVGVFEKPLR